MTQLASRSVHEATPPSGDQIELILREVDALPTLPAIATRLLTITNVEDADLDQIVEIIESDPTLTARLLGLCRTAEKGLGDKITTVRRAVVMLGLEAVQAALLSVAVFEVMRPRSRRTKEAAGAPGEHTVPFDRDGFWRHSLAVASAAELIAERHVELGVKPEEAFVAGLLHDMGKLALEVILPKAYGRVLGLAERRQTSSARAEAQLLGIDHHTIGKRLADHWGLPDAIQDVIWLCGQPLDAMPEQPNRALISIIWVARALCRELHLGWSGDFNTPEPVKGAAGLAKRMGLSSEAVDGMIARLHECVARRCAVLGLGERSTPEMLLEALTQANAKLGRMSQIFEQRARLAGKQTRVLQAIGAFHGALAAAGAKRGIVGTLAAVSRSASSILGEAFLGVVYQSREGEPWQLCCFGQDGKPTRTVSIEPPPASGSAGNHVASLSGLCNPSAIPMRAMGLLSWLAEYLADTQDLRRVALLPVVPHTPDGSPTTPAPSVVLIHDQEGAGTLEPALMEPLLATWCGAIAAAAHHDSATRLQERLATANRTLMETRALLAEAEAMAKLGEFAAGAAHEMNNPLTVISARAQLLMESAKDDADRAGAATIAEHAQRLSDLITSLRLIADPPKPRLETCTLDTLIRSAVAAAQERTGTRELRVRVRVPSSSHSVIVDRPMVASALAELIANAAQASPETPVTIEAQTTPSDGRWFLIVSDQGPGMSAKTLQHAFDPFFSEKPAGRRTGLGLTRARAIIEAHSGEITLASEPAKGTTATIALPVSGRGT